MIKYALIAALLAAAVPTAMAQQQFPTPEAAVDALAAAVAAHDQARISEIFGPDYAAFREGQRSDAALAKLRAQRFTAAIGEFRSLARDSDDRVSLIVGAMGWPFPVPLVRDGEKWHFDGKSGIEELRNRIVGANELNAIAALDVYLNAQRSYASHDYDGDGVVEYAQRVASAAGRRDGLYWEVGDDDPDTAPSPLAEIKELADAVLGERESGSPLLGYRFRILYRQGEHAKAGALDYRINGHMLAGFAMLAWPADYGDTGIMSFIVNQDGVIYQRDLGENTEAEARAITAFDPDDGWTPVVDAEMAPDASS